VAWVGLVRDGRRQHDPVFQDRRLQDDDAGGDLGVQAHLGVDVVPEVARQVIERVRQDGSGRRGGPGVAGAAVGATGDELAPQAGPAGPTGRVAAPAQGTPVTG
jgi:hypothetical protein